MAASGNRTALGRSHSQIPLLKIGVTQARDLRNGKELTRNRVVYHWFDVYDLEEQHL